MKQFPIILIPLFMLIMPGCTHKEKADLIITGSRIYTIDSVFSVVSAMAIRGDRIIATGSDKQILEKYTSTEVRNLPGKVIYPGFIDAHCHFYGYGNGILEADLRGLSSFSEVLETINQHAASTASEWILGRGWDQNDWPVKSFPNRSELDKLFPDRPVLLVRIDGHAALVNGKALEIAGVTPGMEVEGGHFEVNDGKLTGILVDMAIERVRGVVPPPGEASIRDALLRAQRDCFSVGLTSVHDAGLEKNILEQIQYLNSKDSLKMRIYAMLSPTPENIQAYLKQGLYKTPWLSVRSLKLYADGALGSRGARLLEPYSDHMESAGLWLISPGKIKEYAVLADSFGYQVNTHCIGDAANREVLRIYSGILKGKNDKRWRIEHAQVINEQDFNSFGEYSIIPSVQPTHATSDMYWAETRLGNRIKGAYAYNRLLDQNGWLPLGSDFPVEKINPVLGFYAAVSRKDLSQFPEGGFLPEEALSREEALRGMTIWAAKAAFEENEKGSLEPGKYADFVVCDRDIITVSEKEIPGLQVEQTWLGGELVWQND